MSRKPRGSSPSIVVTLRMTAEELAVVDAARGDVPRSVWMRDASVWYAHTSLVGRAIHGAMTPSPAYRGTK